MSDYSESMAIRDTLALQRGAAAMRPQYSGMPDTIVDRPDSYVAGGNTANEINQMMGMGIGAAAGLMLGTPTSHYDTPSRWDTPPKVGYVSPSIEAIDHRPDFDKVDIHVGSAPSPYIPHLAVRPGDALARHDLPPLRLPDMERPKRVDPPVVNHDLLEYNQYGEEGGDYVSAPPLIDPILLRDNAASQQASTLPDMDLPRASPGPLIPHSTMGGVKMVWSVGKTGYGVRLTMARGLTDVRNITMPRYADTKYGKRLVGLVNRTITATYGTYSELNDAVDVFVGNMYGIERGVIKPAMLLERGSTLAVMQGYLEGDYRLDAVGFTVDLGWNQTKDWLIGGWGRGTNAIDRSLGSELPYSADTLISGMQRRSNGESYVQSALRPADQWVRSADARRKSRVSQLWGR